MLPALLGYGEMMYNGIINVYKEAGYTSHDVVAKLRGILRQKKIGHTGTLDQDAVGVLPVCLGAGTKLCDMLTDWNKEYRAVMRLGVETDTQDMSGTVLKTASPEKLAALDEQKVTDTIRSFVGEYEQIPPMYSALKVNGKKLYELAREGKEVERKARTVTIEELEIQEMKLPIVTMRVVCSKGTYIRTLCHDIGEKLGVGGAMEALTRSRVGIFREEDALTLSQLETLRDENRVEEILVKPDAIFAQDQAVCVNAAGEGLVQNGNRLTVRLLAEAYDLKPDEQVRVYDSRQHFYGIYAYQAQEKVLKPVKMFLT